MNTGEDLVVVPTLHQRTLQSPSFDLKVIPICLRGMNINVSVECTYVNLQLICLKTFVSK
jgi:hypothetical protein